MKTSQRYSPEFQERAVRIVMEVQGKHESHWAASVSFAGAGVSNSASA
jgi:hypothetical protein